MGKVQNLELNDTNEEYAFPVSAQSAGLAVGV